MIFDFIQYFYVLELEFINLYYLELLVGIYYMNQGTTLQKTRLIAGVMQEYSDYSFEDFVCLHQKESMLFLVVPKLTNQLQRELTLTNRSKCGLYSFTQSLNIILAHLTPSIASQLTLPCDQITLPFLRSFDLDTRLVGKLNCLFPFFEQHLARGLGIRIDILF